MTRASSKSSPDLEPRDLAGVIRDSLVLVRPELEFPAPGTIEARCTITESGSTVVVPLTAIQSP